MDRIPKLKTFTPISKFKIRQTLLKFPTYFKFKSEKFSRVTFYFVQSNEIRLAISVVTITSFVNYSMGASSIGIFLNGLGLF